MKGTTIKRGKTWTYIVDVGTKPDGTRKQQTKGGFVTKRAAEAALTELIGRLHDGSYVEPTRMTVRQYLLETWLPAIEVTVRASTLYSYRLHVEKDIVPRIGSFPLQKVTPAALNALYAEVLTTGRSKGKAKGGSLAPSSVRKVHTTLHRALRDAVRWNLLARNPADGADPPRARASAAPEMQTWTAPELRRFLDHTALADERLHALWVLAATTGMRRGELLGLQWGDLDLDASRVAVRRTLISVGYEVRESEPKTKKGRRTIDLDATTIAALRSHRVRQAEERLAWGPAYEDRGRVFAREDGSLIHPERVSQLFRKHLRGAGLKAIRFHDVRHTHATLGLAAGVPPKVMSERLGHSTVAFTLDLYTHAIPALQVEAANQVAALIFG